MASFSWFRLSKKYKAQINIIAVIKESGNALFKNTFNPFLILLLFSSELSEIICLMECKKQKYIVKAKNGVKK